jgi:GDPmannose 4,6-dehydratase
MKKALIEFGWAQKIQLKELERIMVDADWEVVRLASPWEGKKVLGERFNGWYYWKGNPIESIQGR